MKIELKEITVRDVAEGYQDSAEKGVTGYGGKLNIRPAFQREFVYGQKERDAVLDTVMKGFPLNVMYWCATDDDTFELLDGQQRTISLCQYVSGDFSIGNRYFHSLTATEQKQILDYKLMIYICTGNDKEKLDWFRTINIAGVQLSDQELRNAVYSGSWVSDAKRYFSKNGCAAVKIGDKLLSGKMIRQEYLETAIEWIALPEGKSVDLYMSEHQHDSTAAPLWMYFQTVINWVNTIFPKWRKEMKGLDWGRLYHEHKSDVLDPAALETKITALMADKEVTKNSGIYEYLLTGKEKYLSLRQFDEEDARTAYEQQQGSCPICKKHFDFDKMHADHITPWHAGGKTVPENLQMLCRDCNLKKSGQE